MTMSDDPKTTQPPVGKDDDNDFHEVWWDSVAGGDAPKGKPQVQLHEVWRWMGDAPEPAWARPGDKEWLSAEGAYNEGWRYVRPIRLLDREMRLDGEPPAIDVVAWAIRSAEGHG